MITMTLGEWFTSGCIDNCWIQFPDGHELTLIAQKRNHIIPPKYIDRFAKRIYFAMNVTNHNMPVYFEG